MSAHHSFKAPECGYGEMRRYSLLVHAIVNNSWIPLLRQLNATELPEYFAVFFIST